MITIFLFKENQPGLNNFLSGNDLDTKKQYQIANAILGFEEVPESLAREDATKESIFESLKERFQWLL